MVWRKVQNCGWVGLLPFSHLWSLGASVRRSRFAHRKPVRSHAYPQAVVVGNIHSGGSGKTPVVAAIVEKFIGQDGVNRLAIVSRGYQGKSERAGAIVDSAASNGSSLFGDEPFMLAKRYQVPVFVGRDRLRSLREVKSKWHDAWAILDDGFQNFGIPNRFDVVVVSAEKDPSQSFLLPLGELREPLSSLASANVLVLAPGCYQAEWEALLSHEAPGVPVFKAEREVIGIEPEIARPVSFGFFCGIASPDRFFSDAASAVKGTQIKAYDDHHTYSDRDLIWLAGERKRAGVTALLTTEKDYWKVQPGLKALGETVNYLKIRYQLPATFFSLIEQHRGNAA